MIGRYQVLKPLAKGGMAEVFLARTLGLKGFERHVVLKFIRVESGSDPKVIEMLLDEARLVASLHHRNIVQVHDVGQDDGKYFFAMEYVHGEDCRALLRRVKDKKEKIPLAHIITIVSAAAAGLHHAHEQRGTDRKPLNIVHRDISPGNILIGFDGGVKVVDFGIAKTDSQSVNTQAGEVKGKVGYMSPEQCKAIPLDRRTDVYMLGIVLYELCTVRRLFKGENRFATMQQIVEGNIPPPSRFRKDLPDELERIILKALATDPADRYQTADDLRLVLEAFAGRANLQVSPSKLSDYVKDLFGERPEPWIVDEEPPDPHDQPTAMMAAGKAAEIFAFDEADGAHTAKPSAPSLPSVIVSGATAQAAAKPAAKPSSVEEPTTGNTPMAWPVEDHFSGRRKRTLILLSSIGGAAALAAVMLLVVWPRMRADDAGASAAPAAGATGPSAEQTPEKPAPEKPASETPTTVTHEAPAPVDAGVEVVEATADAAVTEPTTPDTPIVAEQGSGAAADKPVTPKPKPKPRPRPRPRPDKPKPEPSGGDEDLDSPFPD
jgi:serine/threonine protein kinase